MIKKLNLLRRLVMLSFLTLFALSCKKETESNNFLNEAQKWYLQSTLNSKTSLQSTGNVIESVTTRYMWNKSRYFTLSDGKEVAGTPIEITLGNKELAKGSYMLLVHKMNNVYNYKIIYDEKNNYFSDNLSSSEIEKMLVTSIKNSATKSLAKSREMTLTKSGGQGKLMNHQIAEEVCIDWYLIETITWPDGQVSVHETYLYTVCYTPGGGGSGGGGTTYPGSEIIDWGSPTDQLIGTTEADEESNEPTTQIKTKWFTWKFHDGGYFKLTSYEKSKIKKEENQSWKFTSFSHLSAWPEGTMSTGEDVEINTIDADVLMTPLETTVNLLYMIKFTKTSSSGSFPKYSPSYRASKRFNPYASGTVIEY